MTYALAIFVILVVVFLLWLNERLRRERRYVSKPLTVAEVIVRAKTFPLPATASALVQSDPLIAEQLENELRNLTVVLAVHSGELFLMPSGLQSAWVHFVNQHTEFSAFCQRLLGAGGVFAQTRVPAEVQWNVPSARQKLTDAYEALFGAKPVSLFWPSDKLSEFALDADLLLISGQLGQHSKVLHRDGEFIDFSDGQVQHR